MQGIYTYIPETNHVPREYIAAAILSLLFMVPISVVPVLALLYFYVSTFRSMCAVPNMAVFCSSLTLLLLLYRKPTWCIEFRDF
jgi:presenilin-like A22 family membrane protease